MKTLLVVLSLALCTNAVASECDSLVYVTAEELKPVCQANEIGGDTAATVVAVVESSEETAKSNVAETASWPVESRHVVYRP